MGRLFDYGVVADAQPNWLELRQKVERMRESLTNVRTKWQDVVERAQQFFDVHYDWERQAFALTEEQRNVLGNFGKEQERIEGRIKEWEKELEEVEGLIESYRGRSGRN